MSGMRIGPGDEGELVSVRELAEWLLRDRGLYPVQMLRSLADQQQPEVFMQASAAVPPQGIGADWLYTARSEGRRMLSRGLAGGGAVARPVSTSYSGPAGFLTLWADEWERSGAAPCGAEQVGFRKAWLRQVGFWPEKKPQLLSLAQEAASLPLPANSTSGVSREQMPKIGPPDGAQAGQGGTYKWSASNGLLEEINLQLKALADYYTKEKGSSRGAVGSAHKDLALAWGISESMVKQLTTGDRLADCKRRQQKKNAMSA